MALFSLKPLVSDVRLVSTSLLQNTKLSAESLGVFVFTLGLVGVEDFTIDGLTDAWNAGRSKEKSIGRERMRRLMNEWLVAGFVYEMIETDDDGQITGKRFAIFPQVEVKSNRRDAETRREGLAKEEKPRKPHRFPAAEIFQEYFKVDLDLDSMRIIADEVGTDLKLWQQVCKDHYAGLTPQQKGQISYKTKAVKFVLDDLRVHRARIERNAAKTPLEKDPPDTPKKKTFADYVESGGYEFKSKEYKTFKKRWIEKAEEKGNQAAIEQVEEYEGIQLSLAAIQERKGRKSK